MEPDRLEKAKHYIEQLKANTTELIEECELLRGEMSFYDKELSSFYHKIELKKFNVFMGYKLMIEMKQVLEKRRQVKFQSMVLQTIKDNIFGLEGRIRVMEDRYFNNPKY